jgi:hypothetical protein
MKMKLLSQAAILLLLSAGIVHAGGRKWACTCADCSPECLENPYAKGCPDICKSPECRSSCRDCSQACLRDPYMANCPDICKDVNCQSCEHCSTACKINPDGAGCPDICKDIRCYSCNDCSAECIQNPDRLDCPPACGDLNCSLCDKFPKHCPADCRDDTEHPEKCPDECTHVPDQCLPKKPVCPPLPPQPPISCEDCPSDCKDNPEDCPEKCKDLDCPNDPVTCDDCPLECKDNPEICPEKCQDMADICWTVKPSPFRFIGDIGYYRQPDPADYIFGRIGVEYPLNEQFSALGMVGVAGKIKGDDGDHALLVDVIGQYNWQAGDINGFAGLGLGGWITFGDGDNDSEDTDLDLIANVGARVYGEPNDFNTSVFLEVRSAIDEIDDLTDYGRFGAGVRFQF